MDNFLKVARTLANEWSHKDTKACRRSIYFVISLILKLMKWMIDTVGSSSEQSFGFSRRLKLLLIIIVHVGHCTLWKV